MPTNISESNSGELPTDEPLVHAMDSPPSSDDIVRSLDCLIAKVDELSTRFGKPKTTIIKNLIDNTCEYRAGYEIENAFQASSQKFDSYFKLKHEFEKNRFVQKLALALRRHGLQACISTEEKTLVGVFDVVITNAKFVVTISDKQGKKIVVEWKSSASFSISQIERYLWAATTVILVRSKMGQVIPIRRSDVEQYLTGSLAALTDRSAAIISSAHPLQKIPGPYCKGCPVANCEFYKAINPKGQKVIAFNSDSMQDDMLSMFKNLDQCIEKAIEVVMKELIS